MAGAVVMGAVKLLKKVTVFLALFAEGGNEDRMGVVCERWCG